MAADDTANEDAKTDGIPCGVTLTVLFDNNEGKPGLTPAWGFSCLVQGAAKTILFDTGEKGELVLDHMRPLGLDPARIDAVVLSHIHDDHTGGLHTVLRECGKVPIFVPTGFPKEFLDAARATGATVTEAEEPVDICPGVRTTGTLGKGAIPEHGLCIHTAKGWVLVTGCAHPGPDKMIEAAVKSAGQPMHDVLGGFHLFNWTEQKIGGLVERFESLHVGRAAPCHCSGDLARQVFKRRMTDRCRLVGVGDALAYRS